MVRHNPGINADSGRGFVFLTGVVIVLAHYIFNHTTQRLWAGELRRLRGINVTEKLESRRIRNYI